MFFGTNQKISKKVIYHCSVTSFRLLELRNLELSEHHHAVIVLVATQSSSLLFTPA